MRLGLDPQYLSGIDPVGVRDAAVELEKALHRGIVSVGDGGQRVSLADDIPFGCHRKPGGDTQHLAGINLVHVADTVISGDIIDRSIELFRDVPQGIPGAHRVIDSSQKAALLSKHEIGACIILCQRRKRRAGRNAMAKLPAMEGKAKFPLHGDKNWYKIELLYE